MQTKNLAARAGHWSARHRKTAVLGWLAFVIVAVFAGAQIGTKHIPQNETGTGESGRADRVLDKQFKARAGEQVLVQSKTATVSDPAFRAAVRDVTGRLSALPSVTNISSPLAASNADQVSRDRHSALVDFDVRGSKQDAPDKVGASLDATAAAQRAHPGFRIGQFGDASAQKAFEKAFSDDLAQARFLSIPITLGILVVAFGALAAAGIPVLLALTAVMATMGLLAIPSHISPLDESVSEVVLLIGMAVGVDYSLFYMRREREERAAGRDSDAALQAAAATSGRSVLISGFTVMAAMAGMYFAGDKTFGSFATGTILVVAVAVLGSLTVLPALLSKLGDRVMKGRVPFLARRREANHGESRAWNALLDRVLRRPALSALAAGGVLVALAIPALSLHTASPGVQGLPQGLQATKTLNAIQAAFPGDPTAATVVVQSRDVDSPAMEAAIRRLQARALASGEMRGPTKVEVDSGHTVAAVTISLAGDGTNDTSNRALETLRNDVIPATVGLQPGAKASVTGMTAESKDFNDQMKSAAPIVFAFVLAMAFGLLLVTFRSIVIPVTAIVLNLLSVGAAYGVLVLVFQHGWGESLLGFKSTGSVSSFLPIFLFVILFGLSMDYHVFILSRVREAFDRGMRTDDAVAHGIKSTAGVVTSAAIVMVAVFAIFASLGALVFKQLGVGLATAIFIDATLVRAVLLPATMKLLGDRNWYLPQRLRWLPRISHNEPRTEPARA